ncbi:MAG: Mov34/MPN/PAD-1 family protein [Candidatus Thermoplasmatota archaeon]
MFREFKKRKKEKRKREKWGIKEETLKLLLRLGIEKYPGEFGAILKGKNKLIDEVVLLPGMIEGEAHVLYHLYMLPIDYSMVGTAHSHPSGNCNPSDADIEFFSNFGVVHIITCYPYNKYSWSAYDFNGFAIGLEVV